MIRNVYINLYHGNIYEGIPTTYQVTIEPYDNKNKNEIIKKKRLRRKIHMRS